MNGEVSERSTASDLSTVTSGRGIFTSMVVTAPLTEWLTTTVVGWLCHLGGDRLRYLDCVASAWAQTG